VRVLQPGEFFHKVSFGADVVNRGAVLLECEWCGGSFELGTMLGGVFRGGAVLAGTFSGVAFVDGDWRGGTWLCGYDDQGSYRPRGDSPPYGSPGR